MTVEANLVCSYIHCRTEVDFEHQFVEVKLQSLVENFQDSDDSVASGPTTEIESGQESCELSVPNLGFATTTEGKPKCPQICDYTI